MINPDDLKKGLLILLLTIVAYSIVLIGLGYWLGSYNSEPNEPMVTVPKNELKNRTPKENGE